jgi:hypothetical protein
LFSCLPLPFPLPSSLKRKIKHDPLPPSLPSADKNE